jgi:uncharacterized protein YlxW (UPF0749 family)
MENASCGETDGTVFGNVAINSNYYSANAASTIRYNEQKLELQTLANMQSETLRSETDAQTQTLEAQQEQLQTQLKAVRAEYDSLDEALDKDIQSSTIKLV